MAHELNFWQASVGLVSNLLGNPYALLAGIAPAMLWLWFWLREDRRRPEPRLLIAGILLASGLAVLVARELEQEISPLVTPMLRWFGLVGAAWSYKFLWLIWAAIEEIVKLLTAYVIALRTADFDEPIDAMIYLITAALGFAAFENAFYLLDLNGPDLWLTGNLRFLGSTLLHVVSSAVVGGLIALAFCRPRWQKILFWLYGLITATLLHTIFNLLIMGLQENPATGGVDLGELMRIFALLWLLALFSILFFEKVKQVFCSPRLVGQD
ncbi:MAG: PrsW family glutamic-type intramembrane protease [Patescibacteria group bacterium]